MLAANGVDDHDRRPTTSTRRRRPISHAILTLQPRPHERARRRHRRHAVAQPARGRRLQVQPAARRPGRHRRHRRGSRTRATRCSSAELDGVQARPVRAALARADDAPPRLRRPPTSPTSATSIDLDAIRGARLKHRRRSARRRRRALLGRASPSGTARPHGRQRRRRSDLPLHDARLGRQDPHGSVVALRDAAADRACKDRFDVAFACDTDHDRHGIVTRAAGLLHPNHYLAVAIDYLFTHRPGVAGRRPASARRWSAAADRPRRRAPRPPAARGAGRLQVVRRRAARRLARLRRRGERGRVVPAPRRHGVDDRQGRHRAGAAGGRDDRAAPAAIRASSTPRSRASSATPVYERIDAPATPEQKEQLATLSARRRSRATELAGEPIVARARPARRGNDAPIGGIKVIADERLVRGAALGHRGHLQDLRRELRRRGPPAAHPGGGAGGRRSRDRLTAPTSRARRSRASPSCRRRCARGRRESPARRRPRRTTSRAWPW